jgi:catechol 2,3-dioxygenase-like lactoylglutathione lyase family enzyme
LWLGIDAVVADWRIVISLSDHQLRFVMTAAGPVPVEKRKKRAVSTAHLASRGVAIEGRNDWSRGGRSIYFRDPDGHFLELATPGLWSVY